MKQIVPLMIFLVLLQALSFASEMTFSEKMPQAGKTITVHYAPDAADKLKKDFVLAYYMFRADGSFPIAGQVESADDSVSAGKLEYGVTIDTGTVFVIFKMLMTDEAGFMTVDDNTGHYRDLICAGKDKKPLRGANLQKALSLLGNNTGSIKRNVDYRLAEEFLEYELKFYPDNMEAAIGLLTLQFDTKKIGIAEYEDKVQAALDKKINMSDESNLKAVIRALRIINENEKAEEFEAAYVKKYPASSLAEEKILNRLSSVKSFDEFKKTSEDYFGLFKNSQSILTVKTAFVNAYLQSGKLKELESDLKRMGLYDDMTRNIIARQILTNESVMKGTGRDERRKAALAVLGVEALTVTNIEAMLKRRPDYKTDNSLAPLENQFAAAGALAGRNELLLSALPGSGDSATDYYHTYLLYMINVAPASYSPYAYRTLFERAGKSLDDNTSKLNFLEAAIKFTKSDKVLDSLYSYYYSLVPEKEKQFYYDIRSLKKFYRTNFTDTYKDLKGGKVNGLLQAPDEKFIYMNDFEGKTLVIFFFSTWCGPCQAMFPTYEKLFMQYEKDESVKVIAADIWEHNDDREAIVAGMLKEQPVAFPVYLDITDSLPSVLNITGLPTVLVMDKEGKLRFMEMGFTNEAAFLEKMTDRINYLAK